MPDNDYFGGHLSERERLLRLGGHPPLDITPTPAPSGGTDDECGVLAGFTCPQCGFPSISAMRAKSTHPAPTTPDEWRMALMNNATLRAAYEYGRQQVTPPASAPGSGEVTAWGCEVDELVERIDRMTVEAGPGLDLRPHHQRMLIKEIWRLTEAVERARAEGEAKGRREGAVEAMDLLCGELEGGVWAQVKPDGTSAVGPERDRFADGYQFAVGVAKGSVQDIAGYLSRRAALAEGGGGHA